MNRGQWMKTRRRTSRVTTDFGFRLVRVFSIEHNANRLRVHTRKLKREADRKPGALRLKLFVRRRKREKAAQFEGVSRPGHHYPGQNEATGTRPGAKDSGN